MAKRMPPNWPFTFLIGIGTQHFILAMHVCPDRFLEDEIEAGVNMLMFHIPNPLAAACRICGMDMQDVFVDEPD